MRSDGTGVPTFILYTYKFGIRRALQNPHAFMLAEGAEERIIKK
jgi:hypothetical protein